MPMACMSSIPQGIVKGHYLTDRGMKRRQWGKVKLRVTADVLHLTPSGGLSMLVMFVGGGIPFSLLQH
jgi:hypothetical protein